ncbi:mannonate oxidoreductase [Bacteroidia bacterium]|nr:mannonate oxidoreductase [Bacteroidia bacterium]GHV45779.1 mannonate oxidoreductase [Bacteroidia bacterium]
MLKTGDSVRFLNAVGGGIVRRVDAKQGIVYVEDADGFEVPVLENECVVVPKVSATTNIPIRESFLPNQSNEEKQANIAAENIVEKPDEIESFETEYGDRAAIFLAFFAKNLKELQNTDYECFLLNDSNYYLNFSLLQKCGDNVSLVKNGLLEPNLQEKLADIKKLDVNDWESIHIQIVAFKKEKPFALQKPIDLSVKIPPVNFFKLHSFSDNDYFDKPSMLVNVTELAEKETLASVSGDEIKRAMFTKNIENQQNKKPIAQKNKAEIIEIDLHINALLDNTNGMTNGEMLDYQLNKFHETLARYKNKRGQRIVFIHGKGEGVLRAEIEQQLKTRYKTCYFQDASFQKYGFGATMVMIR